MLRDQTDAAAIVAGKVGTYGGGLSAVLFGLSASEFAALVGALVAVAGLIVQFIFNRRRDRREAEYHTARMYGLTGYRNDDDAES